MEKFVYCENKYYRTNINKIDKDWLKFIILSRKYRNDSIYVKIGRKYEVVYTATPVNNIGDVQIVIKNDLGFNVCLPKSFFMDEVSYLRQEKINQILQ